MATQLTRSDARIRAISGFKENVFKPVSQLTVLCNHKIENNFRSYGFSVSEGHQYNKDDQGVVSGGSVVGW